MASKIKTSLEFTFLVLKSRKRAYEEVHRTEKLRVEAQCLESPKQERKGYRTALKEQQPENLSCSEEALSSLLNPHETLENFKGQ